MPPSSTCSAPEQNTLNEINLSDKLEYSEKVFILIDKGYAYTLFKYRP